MTAPLLEPHKVREPFPFERFHPTTGEDLHPDPDDEDENHDAWMQAIRERHDEDEND